MHSTTLASSSQAQARSVKLNGIWPHVSIWMYVRVFSFSLSQALSLFSALALLVRSLSVQPFLPIHWHSQPSQDWRRKSRERVAWLYKYGVYALQQKPTKPKQNTSCTCTCTCSGSGSGLLLLVLYLLARLFIFHPNYPMASQLNNSWTNELVVHGAGSCGCSCSSVAAKLQFSSI